jgi:putative oxidoreductase
MTARDLGLLALRIGVGGTLFAHGAQKLFGWFGGTGLEQTGARFEQLGFRPGKTNAIAAGLGEAGGGALLAAGLGTPVAAAAVAGTMTVASSMHAARGFFNSPGGFEFPAVLGWSAAALALTGPGAASLDHAFGHRSNRSWMRKLALAAAAPAALAVIAKRRRTVAAQTPAAQAPAAQAPATQTPATQTPATQASAAQPDRTPQTPSSR